MGKVLEWVAYGEAEGVCGRICAGEHRGEGRAVRSRETGHARNGLGLVIASVADIPRPDSMEPFVSHRLELYMSSVGNPILQAARFLVCGKKLRARLLFALRKSPECYVSHLRSKTSVRFLKVALCYGLTKLALG